MTKRLVTMFFIVIGIILFVLTGFFLVLFMAPGFKAFGLTYITYDARKYDSKEVLILDKVNELGYNSFSGSITLETEEVPVNVIFTNQNSYKIHYYENFSGLTKTNIDFPSMTFERDNLGGVKIKITGFEKTLFENSNTKRYVKLYIPLNQVNSAIDGYKTDLTIKSERSDIVFERQITEGDERLASFNNLTIETNGNVKFASVVKSNTYKFTTNNSIIVDSAYKNAAESKNYELESKSGRITLENAIAGNLTATTKNYDIKLVSCLNLNVKTNYGDVVCFKDDAKINVLGMVNIETKSGNVVLGKVSGGAENKITTSSGKVTIDKINNGIIVTKRGSVKIKSLNNMKIETNMGKVFVEEALTKVDVTTKRGKVELGGEGMTINNAKVFSRLGKVFIYSATGTVNVQTISSDVSFTNKDSQNVSIVAGGKLTAKGLIGHVDISAEKNAEIEFDQITENATIAVGDKCKTLVVKAIKNSKNDTRYVLSGKMVTRYEDNDNGTGTFSKIEASENLTNKLDGTGPYLKVTGKNADVSIYFKAEASEE